VLQAGKEPLLGEALSAARTETLRGCYSLRLEGVRALSFAGFTQVPVCRPLLCSQSLFASHQPAEPVQALHVSRRHDLNAPVLLFERQ